MQPEDWPAVQAIYSAGIATGQATFQTEPARLPPKELIGRMILEVLHIDACPNWIEAGHRLEDALTATGHRGITIKYHLLESSEDAADVPFSGSPTITLNGQDLFDAGSRTTDLACRIYFTPAGIAGLPTTEQLIDAITTHEQ